MMAFVLGQRADAIGKVQGLGEIVETKGSFEPGNAVGSSRDARWMHQQSLASGVAGLQVEAHRDDDGDGLFHRHAAALGTTGVEQRAESQPRLRGLGSVSA